MNTAQRYTSTKNRASVWKPNTTLSGSKDCFFRPQFRTSLEAIGSMDNVGLFRRACIGQGVKVTTHLRPVPSLESVELYLHFSSFIMLSDSCIQDFGGDTWGKETTWKNQMLVGG
jgi:hypothetical protein